MREKQPKNVSHQDAKGRAIAKSEGKRLEIGQIRQLVAELQALPDGAALPDWTDMSLGSRFAVALRLIPVEQREKLLGKSHKQLERYGGGAEIPIMVMAALGAKTELPIDWLTTGRPMARKPPLIYVVPGAHDVVGADVPLQKLAFRPAAGRGTLVMDEGAEWTRFPRAVLDRKGVKPENARLMESSGESMRPTIEDRDVMLVDVSSTELIEGKIYVFTIGDEVYVKRLRRRGGKIYMLSDNRDLFPDEEAVPENQPFKIHAQVKGTWKDL